MQPYPEPFQSPLFHAQNSGRYDRQQLIHEYETLVDCRLIVMIDAIFYDSVTLFEELLHDCSPDSDIHLLINSPGGVGEVAIRLVRSAQSRCRELTIIVPDQAKSAATLLAVGAHYIIMAPASDLGPVDPQLVHEREWVAAKDIIAAVEDAIQRVEESPETYPIHAALLGNVTAIMVQQARSALARIHRWTARGQRKVGEGVTGAMIRARIRVDGKLEGDLQALLGHRRRPAEAVVSEMAG